LKRFSLLTILFVFCTSCSIAQWTKRSLLGETKEENKKSKSHKNYVSMQQYDDLLRKYESLRSETKQAKDTSISNPGSALHSASTEQILKELGNADNKKTHKRSDNSLVDTVNVFNDVKPSNRKMPTNKYQRPKSKVSLTIESSDPPSIKENKHQINKFFDAKKTYLDNKMKAALPKFKELEFSQNDQIRVRAKFYIGRIHMEQREYDLALQVFEEIMETSAYSSYVLSSLKELIKCSERLNLHKKRERYQSLLRDVFGLS
jgi:tetratricopeptide (TPR) repeat protein